MSQLDHRLAEDARRWQSAFDNRTELVTTSVSPHQSPGRRRYGVVMSAVATFAVLAAVIVTFAVPSRTTDRASRRSDVPQAHSTAPLTSTGAAPSTRPTPTPSAGVSAALFTRLTRIASDEATGNQDPHPTRAQAVLVTRKQMDDVFGDVTGSDRQQKLWLAAVYGNFTCGGCSVPYGTKTPTGRRVIVALDASTFQGTDLLFDSSPELVSNEFPSAFDLPVG